MVQKALFSGNIKDLKAKDFMTPKDSLITVSASDTVWDVTKIFIDKNIRAGWLM